jgi:Competence protein CoiA-like family
VLYAVSPNGDRILPVREAEAKCPSCGSSVVPKMGRINAHHWAHAVGADCDTWSEPETEWHLGWKALVEPQFAEVTLKRQDCFHRADIQTHDQRVIELQRSGISGDEILERNQFYNGFGKTLWVFYGGDFMPNVQFISLPDGGWAFDWNWPRKTHERASKNAGVFWDFGGDFLFKISKFEIGGRTGSGHFVPKASFITRYLGMSMRPSAALDWLMRPKPFYVRDQGNDFMVTNRAFQRYGRIHAYADRVPYQTVDRDNAVERLRLQAKSMMGAAEK